MKTNKVQPKLEVIEFFSGIGGYRFALERSQHDFKVIQSYDINTIANQTYFHIFQEKPSPRSIANLTLKELDKPNINCWVLSPPCQPFTRGGSKLEDQDLRCEALNNLLIILEEMKYLPQFFCLENVFGFETSRSRDKLIEVLNKRGFFVLEFLLTPLQWGIPNDRLRYYCLACLEPSNQLKLIKERYGKLITQWPLKLNLKENEINENHNIIDSIDLKDFIKQDSIYYDQLLTQLNCCNLELILEDLNEVQLENYLVPETYLNRAKHLKLDIVQSNSKRSACFTKSYASHHIYGSHTLIDINNNNKLRFFTANEIALLLGFPTREIYDKILNSNSNSSFNTSSLPFWFQLEEQYRISKFNENESEDQIKKKDLNKLHYLSFPKDLNHLQPYRLLGNSINVVVVSDLLNLFLI